MVLFRLDSCTELDLDPTVFSPAYLAWVEAMLADPTEARYQSVPVHGGTRWVDGQWGFHCRSTPGLRLMVTAPLVGELGSRYRDLVAEHLTDIPRYLKDGPLSLIPERRARLGMERVVSDRPLRVAWLEGTVESDGPIAEVVVAPTLNTWMGRQSISASRAIVTDDTRCHHRAPLVIIQSTGCQDPQTQILCQHLVIIGDDADHWRRLVQPQYRLLSMIVDGQVTHHLSEEESTPELTVALRLPDLPLTPSQTLVTWDSEEPSGWVELMEPVDEDQILRVRLGFWQRAGGDD